MAISAFGKPTSSATGDTAQEGFDGAAARSDHKHGREAADANYSGTPSTSAVGDAAAVGVSTTGSRSDHKHGREAFGSPVAIAATGSDGVATTLPRSDHVHALAALGAWTPYTPTIAGTGWAIGNGTSNGRYAQFGKMIQLIIRVTFGSTSTFGSGGLTLSLPTAAAANSIDFTGQGSSVISGANSLVPIIASGGSTVLMKAPQTASGTNPVAVTEQNVTSTFPQTWANGSRLDITITYEAA